MTDLPYLLTLIVAIGTILTGLGTLLGVRYMAERNERDLNDLATRVVYKDTCEQCKGHNDHSLAGIHGQLAEIRSDIKTLLRSEAAR